VRRTRHVPVTQRRLGGQAGLHLLVVVVHIRVVEVLLVLLVVICRTTGLLPAKWRVD